MKNENTVNRRKFLSSAGAATIGFTGLSAAKKNQGRAMSGSETRSLSLSKSNSMSESERDSYISEMEEKYGAERVGNIFPDKSSDGGLSTMDNSPDTTNLTWEDSWNRDFNVYSDQTGVKLAVTDHAVTLYSGNETDNNDRTIYFLWHWSQSEAVDGTGYYAQTSFVRNHVELNRSGHKLTDFDPSSVKDVDGRKHDIGLNVGYNGITMGINGEVYLKNGAIKPETGKIDTGGAGQASYIFEGCQDGTTGLNGVTEVRGYDFINKSEGDANWNLYVKATTVSGC